MKKGRNRRSEIEGKDGTILEGETEREEEGKKKGPRKKETKEGRRKHLK